VSYDGGWRMTDPVLQSGPPEIPDKLYFKIGEVSDLLGVEPYVLRYWETEFATLSPKKSGTGHRLYRRKDVELLLRIKHLLYDRKFTIEGARQTLQQELRGPKPRPMKTTTVQRDLFASDPLPEIRRELAGILEFLK
jgi:DNA-binding transcriptional MerR regulator